MDGWMDIQVWASEDESAEFPYLGGKPPIPGDLARLQQQMNLAGVQGALIVQPINHKFDHAYVNRALQVRRLSGSLLFFL